VSTILVTGGSGFIGSHTVERLLRDGHEVISFSRSVKPAPRKQGLRSFLGDIRDETAVFEAMAHCDGFIHLAGILGTQETIQNPRPSVDTNVRGGLNVLEAAARYKVPGVNIAVGNHWEQNPYSISKSTVERFAKMYNQYRGTNVAVVRALNAYGPGQSVAAPYGPSQVRKIMPSFVMRALRGDPIEIYGNGSQVMDMIYVSDVADILVDALYYTKAGGESGSDFYEPATGLEAGTGVTTTVSQIARSVCEEVGVDSGRAILHVPMRDGEKPNSTVLGDPSTLWPVYGDYPKGFISLKDGVKRTVEFYKNVY